MTTLLHLFQSDCTFVCLVYLVQSYCTFSRLTEPLSVLMRDVLLLKDMHPPYIGLFITLRQRKKKVRFHMKQNVSPGRPEHILNGNMGAAQPRNRLLAGGAM